MFLSYFRGDFLNFLFSSSVYLKLFLYYLFPKIFFCSLSIILLKNRFVISFHGCYLFYLSENKLLFFKIGIFFLPITCFSPSSFCSISIGLFHVRDYPEMSDDSWCLFTFKVKSPSGIPIPFILACLKLSHSWFCVHFSVFFFFNLDIYIEKSYWIIFITIPTSSQKSSSAASKLLLFPYSVVQFVSFYYFLCLYLFIYLFFSVTVLFSSFYSKHVVSLGEWQLVKFLLKTFIHT